MSDKWECDLLTCHVLLGFSWVVSCTKSPALQSMAKATSASRQAAVNQTPSLLLIWDVTHE